MDKNHLPSRLINLALIIMMISCAGVLGPDIKPGIKLAAEGKHGDALKHYESIIESGKANAKVYRLAYESAFLAGKRNTAAGYYQKALDAGFDADSIRSLAVDLWYDRTLTLMGKDQWTEAIKATAQITELAPDSDQDTFCRLLLSGKKKFDRGAHKGLWEAISEYAKAANLDSESGLPYYLMGQARYKNDRTNYDSALEDYYEALKIEPNGLFADQARAEIKKIEGVKKKMNAFWGK